MTEKHKLKRHPLSLAVSANINRGLFALSLCLASTQVMADPFFSEYAEGSSNNKALEIYNPGPGSFDLNGCQVKMYFNGGLTVGLTHTFGSAVIAAGDVYVLTNPSAANATLLAASDGVTASSSWFNGDDAVELVCAAVTKDVIGQIGLDPGTEWGTGNASTADNTLVRKSTVCAGDTVGNNTFTPSTEWDGFAVDTFSSLGSHTASCASSPTVNLSVSANTGTEAGATVITVTATASAAVTGDQTVNLGVSGTGITAGDYSLSNTAITIPAGQTIGTVTFTVVDDTEGEPTETAALSISNASAGITLGTTTSQNISITDNDSAPIPPNLSINDVSQNEGNSGTTNFVFTVSLDAVAPTGGVSFNIATADVTATAGSDYVTQSTSQTIPAGSTSATFTVAVNGDTTVESNETFSVNVTGVNGATASDAQGTGTITNDDVAACGDPATLISEVQGTGATTPLIGQAGTTIEGIVVGDYQGANGLKGFFVQEEDADADNNPSTSEGIFVYENATNLASVMVGDKVRVTGTPSEFFGSTQLSSLTSILKCGIGTIPAVSPLTLSVRNVPNGNLAIATAAIDSYYEPFEGMLVKFPANLKVSEYFELERFGQLVLSQGGRIPTFTNVRNPSEAGYINHQIMLAKRQIVLDDGNDIQNFYTTNNAALPYPTGGLSITNRFRGGDTIKNLTGVLQYSFSQWRLRPVEELVDYTFVAENPRKATSPNVGGDLKVASFNVLNYFTTVDTTPSTSSGPCAPSATQDCRGADSAAELARQTDKAAQALCGLNADIVGLMEIENNASASLQALVDAANGVCGANTFSYINTGTIGTDAIKVALLYKPATVSPVNAYQLLDSTDDVRFIDDKNRPSLAQTFSQTATGERLTIVVNHLKSKGSACDDVNPLDVDKNDGQGNCNLTRKAAAEALVDWLASDPTGSGDPDYLIIGDLNSYAKEDPIKAIEKGADDNAAKTNDNYTNMVKNFGGNATYSYVFDGQTGYLDHALASKSLVSQITGTANWHINADEPPSFDYNDTIKDNGEASFEAKSAALPLYAADQYRTSDHDPVVIGVKLTETINAINGTVTKETLSGTAGKDRITGFGGADTLSGGLNDDVFVYASTTDGVDTIIDFTLGEDKIDLTALMLSLGYQGNGPIADGIVKFAASGSNAFVYIDADGTAGSAAKRALIKVIGVSAANLNNPSNFKF